MGIHRFIMGSWWDVSSKNRTMLRIVSHQWPLLSCFVAIWWLFWMDYWELTVGSQLFIGYDWPHMIVDPQQLGYDQHDWCEWLDWFVLQCPNDAFRCFIFSSSLRSRFLCSPVIKHGNGNSIGTLHGNHRTTRATELNTGKIRRVIRSCQLHRFCNIQINEVPRNHHSLCPIFLIRSLSGKKEKTRL